jgi:hypothetical protein
MYKLSTQLGIPVVAPFLDDSFVPDKPVVYTKNTSTQAHSTDKQVNFAKVQENEENLKREGQEGCLRQQTRHEQEWEECRVNDPEKFARWESNAKLLRAQIGMSEDGTFANKAAEIKAVDTLLGKKTTTNDGVTDSVVWKTGRQIMHEVLSLENNHTMVESTLENNHELEDYSDDPFGDRNK